MSFQCLWSESAFAERASLQNTLLPLIEHSAPVHQKEGKEGKEKKKTKE